MIRLLTQKDKEAILAYLGRNEIETSFLYGNVIEFGVDNNPEIRRCADYYGYFSGEELKGILPFYNLGSCIPHYEEEGALPLFAEIMKKRSFDIILGMKKVVEPLYFQIKDHKEIESCDESSYYINKDFKPYQLDEAAFINIDQNFGEAIVDFVVEARLKGFNHRITREEVKKILLQKSPEEGYILLEVNDQFVAQACIQTYTKQFSQIGSVYTLQEERGKGYCKAIVSELCNSIISKGKIPTLSVKKSNVPAVRAYGALGFKHYDDYLIVKIKVNK
ncbi:GNAT family N-acetyltransferase [Alkaliphilus transvaalensis]|uniref:GNAT family N-acetyltransferase n=1 Tax=Alkaliphilus transvaalensis TaxID=114628 RepID=UPI00047C2706|nr:GNAT family N-acetyltransferase [Alkaliphilus transvaalensis]